MAIFMGADVSQTYTSLEEGKTPALGDVFFGSGNKVYKFVQYNQLGSLDLAAGDVVTYTDDSGYAASDVTADASAASGQNIGAGVAQAAVTADGVYFWVQIKGRAVINVALGGSAADGDPLTAEGAADKGLTRAIEADSTGVYKPVCAIAVDATAKEIICDFPF